MRRPSSPRAAASSARAASRRSRSRTPTARRSTGPSAMSALVEAGSAGRASAELACVPPGNVARLWPHVAHYIMRAMARGGMGRFADVEADVLAGNAYLWVAIEAGEIL